ncbi:MAG: putative signal transducing protein [Burkholderiaceae bacterium]
MKLIARADHPLQAAIWADTLRAAGIPCEVRNTALSGAMGEIPFLECAPQVWLLNESDETHASEILQQLRQPVVGSPWRCTQCGEESEPQFGTCWKCEAERPRA